MKAKTVVSKATQKMVDVAMWMIIGMFVLFIGMSSAKAEMPTEAPVIEKVCNYGPNGGVNRNVKKYHRQNRRNFHCSLCPATGLRKFIPKRWR